LPAPIDVSSSDLQDVLNKTEEQLQKVVNGQTSVNIFRQAKEVQFHVVIVCVFVCMFCVFVLAKC